jgi:hypothetical protein
MTYYKIKTNSDVFKQFAADKLNMYIRQYGFIYWVDNSINLIYFATDNTIVLNIVKDKFELEITKHPDLHSIENCQAVNFDLYFSDFQNF